MLRPQSMQVVLDTGSSDLWFTTTGCLDCTAETPLFNPAKSSSLQKGIQDVPLSYGSDGADGHSAHDTVSVASFTVNSQAFGVWFPRFLPSLSMETGLFPSAPRCVCEHQQVLWSGRCQSQLESLSTKADQGRDKLLGVCRQ